MMGFSSSEVYNTIYNTTTTNANSNNILQDDQQLKERAIDTQLVIKVEKLYKTYNLEDNKEYNQFVEKANKFKVESFSEKKKLTRNDTDQIKSKNETFNNQTTNKEQQPNNLP